MNHAIRLALVVGDIFQTFNGKYGPCLSNIHFTNFRCTLLNNEEFYSFEG
jgi:hypothetical protein